VFDAYPTITEPLDDVPYAWLEPPPRVPGHSTLDVVLVLVPPLALSEDVSMPYPRARIASSAEHGSIFLVTVRPLNPTGPPSVPPVTREPSRIGKLDRLSLQMHERRAKIASARSNA